MSDKKQRYCLYKATGITNFNFNCHCENIAIGKTSQFVCSFYKKELPIFTLGKDIVVIKPFWCENTGMVVDWERMNNLHHTNRHLSKGRDDDTKNTEERKE